MPKHTIQSRYHAMGLGAPRFKRARIDHKGFFDRHEDVTTKIFGYLTVSECIKARSVSKAFRSVADSEGFLTANLLPELKKPEASLKNLMAIMAHKKVSHGQFDLAVDKFLASKGSYAYFKKLSDSLSQPRFQVLKEDPDKESFSKQDQTIFYWKNPTYFGLAERQVKEDRDIASIVLAQSPASFKHLSAALKQDDTFGRIGVQSRCYYFEHVSERLKNDREVVLEAVQRDGDLLIYAAPRFRDDFHVAREAVRSAPDVYEFLSLRLRAMPEIYELALAVGYNLEHAPLDVRSNRDAVRRAVSQWGLSLEFAAFEWRDDQEIVEMACDRALHAGAASFASERLLSDKGFVKKLVSSNGCVFQYLPEAFRDDLEVALLAVRNFGGALQFASQRLRGNGELVSVAIKNDGAAYQYASQELRSQKDMALLAMRYDGLALEYAPASLKADRDVVRAALDEDALALEFAGEEFRQDKSVVLECVHWNGSALEFAMGLRDDYEVVSKAVAQDGMALEFASPALRGNRQIVLTAIAADLPLFYHTHREVCPLQFASRELCDDYEVVEAAVQKHGMSVEYASSRLKGDKDIIQLALKSGRGVLDFVDKKVLWDSDLVETVRRFGWT